MTDLVTNGLTNAVTRDGQGKMTAQFSIIAGTAATPGLAFTAETSTGLYRPGANQLGASVSGTQRQLWTTSGTSITGTLDISGVTTATGGVVGNLTGNVTGSVTGAASLNVLKAGDTMTGQLINTNNVRVQATGAALSLWKDGTPTKAARVAFNTADADGVALQVFDGSSWLDSLRISSAGDVAVGGAPAGYGAGYAAVRANGSTGGVFDMAVGGTRTGTIFATASEVRAGAVANVPLNLYTNNTQRVAIAAAGNVTISAPSSGNTVQINAAGSTQGLVINYASGGASPAMQIGATSGNTVGIRLGQSGIVNWDISNIASSGNFTITNGAQTPFTASGSGNVTIGAPSSGVALTVNGIGNATIQSVTDGTRNLALGTDTVNGTVFLGALSNHGTDIIANGSTRVRVASGGNVTISAPTSGASLTVTGAAAAAPIVMNGVGAASFMNYQRSGSSVGDIGSSDSVISGGSSGDFAISSRAGGLVLGTNTGVARVAINSSGNVTINSPASGNFTLRTQGNSWFDATDGAVGLTAGRTGGNYSVVGYNMDLSANVSNRYDYRTTDFMSFIRFQAGGFEFITAPSSSGTSATITTRLTLGNTGNVTIPDGTSSSFRVVQNGITNRLGSTSNGGVLSSDAGNFLLQTNGTTRIEIATGGKTTFSAGAFTTTSSQAFTATPTFDANLSNVFEFSGAMTANVTSCTITNPSNGQTISIRVKQDGTGSRTFAAPSGAKITGSIGATAGAASILTLTYSAMDSRWEGSWLNLPV